MPLFKQTDGTWKALVNHIPVGTQAFAAKAYDSVAKTHEIYSGSVANVTITKNAIADVVIVLQEKGNARDFGNHAPIVDSLSVSATSAVYGEKIAYTLAAHDPDPNETLTLNFFMDPSCGSFPPTTATMNGQGQMVWASLWTAPASGTSCQLNMVITDVHGAQAMAAVTINISAGVDVGGARVSTLVESYPVLTGITTNPAVISGAGGDITLTVLYSMSDNETPSFAWTHPDCDGTFINATIANPVFTLTTVPTMAPSSTPPRCTFGVVVSGPPRTPTNGTAQQLSTSGSLTVNVGQSTVPQNDGGGVAIDMTSQSLETVLDPTKPVTLYVKASEHTAGATLTRYDWSKLHGTFGTQIDAPDLGNSQIDWTPPASMDPNELVYVLVTDSLGATASYTFIIGRGINPCVGPNTDGVLCSDGDPCTVDHCLNQVCVSGPQNPCTAVDQCHENGVCDHVDGSCSTPLSSNGKTCNDGHGCTTGDQCTAGVCGGTAVTCHALDACHGVGTCDDQSQNGDCSNPVANVNGPCNDNNVCTVTDLCQSDGSCVGTPYAATCTTPSACHTATGASCLAVGGTPTCVYPIDNTATCSDSNACTTGDFCSNGTCQPGPGVLSCTADACHDSSQCDSSTGCVLGQPHTCTYGHCRLPLGTCATCPSPSYDEKFPVTSFSGMTVDSSGNQYVVSGLYGSNNNYGGVTLSSAGGSDLVVAKLNPADSSTPATGTGFWAKRFSGSVSQEPSADQSAGGVAVSGGTGTVATRVGVIGAFTGGIQVNSTTNLAGSSSMTGFILATDGDGMGLWAKSVNTQTGALVAIAGNPSRDEFAVCGYAKGAVTDLGLPGTSGGDSQADIIIAKLNATDGTVIWSRQIGGAGTQFCTAVALKADGSVFASGTYNGTLGLDTGVTDTYDATVLAIWVAKFANGDEGTGITAGQTLLAKSYGNTDMQAVKFMALDSAGDLAIAGNLQSDVLFRAGTSEIPEIHLTSAGGLDGFVVKLKGSDLTAIWGRNWGDANNDQEAHSVAFDSYKDVVVVGYLQGTAPGLSSTTLTSAGGSDAYWAKFDGTGGTSICAANYGDAKGQVADLVAISTADGTQKDKVNVVGYAKGTFSFGAVTPPFSSNPPNAFMLQLTP
jgi:hypothetical protein